MTWKKQNKTWFACTVSQFSLNILTLQTFKKETMLWNTCSTPPLWEYLPCISIAKQEHTHTNTYTHLQLDKNSRSPLCIISCDLADTLLLEAPFHSAAYPCAAFELSCQESVTPRASFFDFQEWSGHYNDKIGRRWGAEREQRALTEREKGALI